MAERSRLAEELNGQNLGQEIEFYWEFPLSKVQAKVTGELREVSHDGRDVFIWVTSDDALGGDKTEFILEPGALVILTVAD